MNVALLIGTFPPDEVGGTEIQAAELARRLAARDHHVVVLTRSTRRRSTEIETMHGVTVYRHGIPARMVGRSFLALAAKHRTLSTIQPVPEVLLAYHLVDAGLIARILGRVRGIPFVVWLRSEFDIAFIDSARGRMIGRAVLGGAEVVLTQTDELGRRLIDTLRAAGLDRVAERVLSRLAVVGNGVGSTFAGRGSSGDHAAEGDNTLALSPAAATGVLAGRLNERGPMHQNRDEPCGTGTGFTGGQPRVLFAGRLREDKGIFDLIEACRAIAGAHLVFAGDGPDRARIASASAGIPVEILGLVSQTTLAMEMARSTVLCLPSWHEGLPNVILEAQAMGLPVVATGVGGVPALVIDGESGLLVSPRDPSALASVLRRALTDAPLRARLARGGLESARRSGWEELLPRIETILLAAARRTGPRAVAGKRLE